MVRDEASADDTVLMLDDHNFFEPEAVSALIESLTPPDHVISANVPPSWANAARVLPESPSDATCGPLGH